ncbi:MAG: hypothetical protein MST05_11180 [Treponema sp.]|nr:hypothetical protein [Treponema sp.]
MIFRKIKVYTILVLLFSFALPAFAVEAYISDIYKKIDQIFIIQSEDQLKTLLSDNNEDSNYYLIENYTEKKIRRLIVNNEYDFAMTAIIIVIENNLDNEQAVEMYSVIADAYKVQQEHEAELEYQRQLELARIEKAKEKQRVNVEKEYVAAKNTNSGKSVYVTGKETKLTSYRWKVALGLADFMYLHDNSSNINSLHYGPSLSFNYEYMLESKTIIGAELFAGVQPIGIAEEKSLVPLIGDIDVKLKLSPSLIPNMFITTGFGVVLSQKDANQKKTNLIAGTMYTPIVGIKYERISLGNVKVDLGAEWYAGHLFYDNINFAMGAEANAQIPFADLDKVSLNFNIGLRDKVLVKASGLENRASLILAIGAENVIK